MVLVNVGMGMKHRNWIDHEIIHNFDLWRGSELYDAATLFSTTSLCGYLSVSVLTIFSGFHFRPETLIQYIRFPNGIFGLCLS